MILEDKEELHVVQEVSEPIQEENQVLMLQVWAGMLNGEVLKKGILVEDNEDGAIHEVMLDLREVEYLEQL